MGVAAVVFTASVAQANYLLLLNGKSVSSMNLSVELLNTTKTAENGLEIECEGGTGLVAVKLAGGGAKVVGSASVTLEGCIWVGSESVCTINDGGEGLVNLSAEGELVMSDPSSYKVTASSSEFTTLFTEGIFCTIPEEEVISGTMSVPLLNVLGDTKVKLAHLNADALKLGNLPITELSGESHIRDADNPNATFGIHLVAL